MIDGMFNCGSMPVTERLVQFTAARHQLILNNIANISTPNYRPQELSVDSFQQALGKAIDARRAKVAGSNQPLEMPDTRELEFTPSGIEVKPQNAAAGILFHDRNDRSVETEMKNLAENTMTHNMALSFLKSKYQLLETAIRERV